MPARRKFLKTDNTEAAHIIHLSRLFAVANPNTSFSLLENGRTLFRSPVCQNLRERVGEIFGRQIAGQLIEIEVEDENFKHDRIDRQTGEWGGPPGTSWSPYVNRRPVDSRTLKFSLIEAYHTYIPKGRYPLAFIFLEVDPALVDIQCASGPNARCVSGKRESCGIFLSGPSSTAVREGFRITGHTENGPSSAPPRG